MSIEEKIADDHPMMRAWKEYRASEDAKNSEYWAKHITVNHPRNGDTVIEHPHVEGSLWAAFVAGYKAAAKAEAARGFNR